MARIKISEVRELKEQLDKILSEVKPDIAVFRANSERLATVVDSLDEKLSKANLATSEIEQQKEAIDNTVNSVNEIKNESEADSIVVKKYAEEVEQLKQRSTARETQLKELIGKAKDLQSQVESLLPGATSAGLASAFRERKEAFKIPKRLWGTVFVISVIALIFVGFFNPFTFTFVKYTELTEGNVFSYILSRLPFIVPIVWLGIYAGRRHGQALRLEEDYAHKEALSKSFEGYKVQLKDLEIEQDSHVSTLNLINKTLDAISLHPDRIYQGRQDDITPLHPIKTFFQSNKPPPDKNGA